MDSVKIREKESGSNEILIEEMLKVNLHVFRALLYRLDINPEKDPIRAQQIAATFCHMIEAEIRRDIE